MAGQRPAAGRFNVRPSIPEFDEHTYQQHLTDLDWTQEETTYLLELYQESAGKWPVIADAYDFAGTGGTGAQRTLEDLKSRFYSLSATLLNLRTPISSMTQPEFSLFETLSHFDPARETARKKLVEAHLKRHQSEVDEEAVLLSELQRIMVQQAGLDREREDLRRRLDYPHANTNGYQYATSQSLTTLWQQLLAADRLKKNQRLRPTGHPVTDGSTIGATPTSSRPSNNAPAGLPESATQKSRLNRDSLTSSTSAHNNPLPTDLSSIDQKRYGVVLGPDKLPSGVTFASDRLSKPRIAKSTIQTEKISTILTFAQVPDLIPLPTPAVIEQFEVVMSKVHALLDLRKMKDREEQELKVRQAES